METKNSTTLIIDGNWLLMSRLGRFMNEFSVENSEQKLEDAKNSLIDLIAQSINKAINFWNPCIDNIMLVQDGGSWRKHISQPPSYKQEYKGNRVPLKDLSWKHIWSALDVMCKKFKENNISCISERNVEGDDWCWYWSRYLNHEGINCILWTSDADLKQLIRKDPSGAWTLWYNDNAGLFLPNCLNQSEMDILLNFEAKDPLIENVTSKVLDVNYINPEDIVMMKTICGDNSDNIRSLIQIQTESQSGKQRKIRISEREWLEVKNALNIASISEFLNLKKQIISELLRLKRFRDCQSTESELSEIFDYNFQMVYIDQTQIPRDILRSMNKHKEEYIITDLDYLKNNYKVLSSQTLVVEDLFKDIPF